MKFFLCTMTGVIFVILVALAVKKGQVMPKKKDLLSTYSSKRNFAKTPEPTGKTVMQKLKKSKNPIFVIQKHDASHVHYDVRLQIGDVLVSWAVPKGPSLNPKIKRLAVQTEDHPLDYAYFEGVIPEGYGAGTVMVWDIGTYSNIKTDSMEQCLREGKIEIDLKGKKLSGSYALIRTHYGDGDKKNWLLFKLDDEYADARKNPVSTQDYSALTNRTLKEIKKDEQNKNEE